MRLEDKEKVVQGLRERLERASVTVLAAPRGLTVAKVTKLRRQVRELSGEYKIAKNTLAIRAVDATSFAPLGDLLEGPTALVFGYGDPVTIVKAMVAYSTENSQNLEIKGAVLDGQLLGPADVAHLAKLEGRDQQRARLLGVLAASATRLVRTLAEPGASLARALAARASSAAAPGEPA